MEWQSVPVSLPTVWPSLCPSHLHKINETSGCFPERGGIRPIIYLDDLLILCSCRDTLINQLELVRDLFQMLGLLINNKKSQLEPSQEIVSRSSISMRVSPPKEKVTKIP